VSPLSVVAVPREPGVPAVALLLPISSGARVGVFALADATRRRCGVVGVAGFEDGVTPVLSLF